MGLRRAPAAASWVAFGLLAAAPGAALAHQDDARLDALFDRLAGAADPHEAARIEDLIWRIWIESGDERVDGSLALGVRAMQAGDLPRALAAFEAVVRVAPGLAEGWNKRATLFWLMGDWAASLADIDRTLALEPRHFGALSGLALIREAQGRPFEALEALQRVTPLHPHMAHLAERMERLTRQMGQAI